MTGTARRGGTAAALILSGICAAASAAAQIPPSVEFRVPKPPTLAAGSDGAFLTYELHVTNLTASPMTLQRVEVFAAGEAGTRLATLGDTALVRATARPGPPVPATERTRIDGGMRAIVYLWIPVGDGVHPAALRHRLVLERTSETSEALEGAVTPVAPSGTPLGPPLRGEWVAVNGPSNASGHRRLVLALEGTIASGQRFGADFLQVDANGTTFSDDRSRNENFHAYGQDILAVADGVVVDTRDGIPENTGGPQSRAVPITLETVSGNHVVIDIGDGRYAFYAHLIPGSLRVRVGDRVRRGQVIGLVGNSGNSTEPHLHFHLVDAIARSTATLGAEGIPYALDRFELLGRCTSFAGGGCTREPPVVLTRAMPLQNQIVKFPE